MEAVRHAVWKQATEASEAVRSASSLRLAGKSIANLLVFDPQSCPPPQQKLLHQANHPTANVKTALRNTALAGRNRLLVAKGPQQYQSYLASPILLRLEIVVFYVAPLWLSWIRIVFEIDGAQGISVEAAELKICQEVMMQSLTEEGLFSSQNAVLGTDRW